MTSSAEEAAKKCAEANSEYFSALKSLEDAGKKMNEGLQQIAEDHIHTPDYIQTYASILEKLANFDRAEEAYVELVRVATEFHHFDESCFAKYVLAQFLIRRKRFQEAYEVVQIENRERYPNQEILLETEFLAFVGNGEREKASSKLAETKSYFGDERGKGLIRRMQQHLDRMDDQREP